MCVTYFIIKFYFIFLLVYCFPFPEQSMQTEDQMRQELAKQNAVVVIDLVRIGWNEMYQTTNHKMI